LILSGSAAYRAGKDDSQYPDDGTNRWTHHFVAISLHYNCEPGYAIITSSGLTLIISHGSAAVQVGLQNCAAIFRGDDQIMSHF